MSENNQVPCDEALVKHLRPQYQFVNNYEKFLNENFAQDLEYQLIGGSVRQDIKLKDHTRSLSEFKQFLDECNAIYEYGSYEPFEFHSTKDGKFLTVLVRAFGKFKSDGSTFRHDLAHMLYLDNNNKIRMMKEYMVETQRS